MWLVIPLLFITSQRGTVIFGIFRGDFGDFIPPRRPMQIMVPWSEWVTSTTGCMADLALCPFRFSRVKTVSFFWKGKYIHRFSQEISLGMTRLGSHPVFPGIIWNFGQGSSRQLHVRRAPGIFWGPAYFQWRSVSFREGNRIRFGDSTYSKVPDKTWIEISSSSSQIHFSSIQDPLKDHV